MRLEEALSQITEIRAHLDRAEVFRGYRAATVAFSGGLGIGTAVVQMVLISDPTRQLAAYLTLWITAAVLSLSVVACELAWRYRNADSPRTTRHIRMAVEQFSPSLVAGTLVTFGVVYPTPENAWMLPGLWAIIFSLGVFASFRLLPPVTFYIGVYYLAAGGICLGIGSNAYALSPWIMGGVFGVGQLLSAAILYWTLERNHETSEAT